MRVETEKLGDDPEVDGSSAGLLVNGKFDFIYLNTLIRVYLRTTTRYQ
jgi:hypothetical protein